MYCIHLRFRARAGAPESGKGSALDLRAPWTPTVLVNELYLELVKIKALRASDEDSSERDAFLKLAGHIMRRLLIHHARPLSRRAQKLDVTELESAAAGGLHSGTETLAQIEDFLERLQKLDPRLRTVVELRVFEGKTADETAVADVRRRVEERLGGVLPAWQSLVTKSVSKSSG